MLSIFEIQKLIDDDVGNIDLTTSLQNIKNKTAKLEIFTREDIVISGLKICRKMAKLLDLDFKTDLNDGNFVKKGGILIELIGDYNDIHKIWKSAQILLEYSCKISTYTANMVSVAKKVNPKCQILTTRKTFPLSKKICLQAVISGGGKIHRNGLDDSVLFFDNHLKVYKNLDEFISLIDKFKKELPEKKIVVEMNDFNSIKKLLKEGIDGIQCDKTDLDNLKNIVRLKNDISKNSIILASGGINIKNIEDIASCGVDGAVTSAPYVQGMADISSRLFII